MEGLSATGSEVRVLGPEDGDGGILGSIAVRFMVNDADSGGGFSLVEHAMSSRALAAPLHRHVNEDEYSFVLEGQVGALLGDKVISAGAGTLIFKPRNQWHTFWNDSESPAKILEIISPAGFEQFFREVLKLGGIMNADPQQLGALCARFKLEMDPSSVASLVERFGLRFPGEPLPLHL